MPKSTRRFESAAWGFSPPPAEPHSGNNNTQVSHLCNMVRWRQRVFGQGLRRCSVSEAYTPSTPHSSASVKELTSARQLQGLFCPPDASSEEWGSTGFSARKPTNSALR
ncbi:hypothetical protein Q7C36_012216 [Tachysurus vachellii]|uniref:Uncharacterized protein n=1 Tax=Tachysurus vachellii TaxID=175792 RepID=A0AA88MPM7_TACVA|nr:hypothetical protein Q7C36_012216 [Tachysurus vachellii]